MSNLFPVAVPLGSGPGPASMDPIHIEGTAFKLPSGKTWRWGGHTDFKLYQQYLNGDDIEPIIQDRLKRGVRVVRVFGMMDVISHFYPQEHPAYYDLLRPFADYLKSRGLRLEFAIFADALTVMPSNSDREYHTDRVCDALAGHPTVFIEPANEPGHGGQIGDVEAHALGQRAQTYSLLVGTSVWDQTLKQGMKTFPCLDYVTVHTSRDDEWPRKARSADELCHGFSWDDGSQFGGFHVPVVCDEPMGAAEVGIPGKRSDVPADFRYYAATASLMCAGATFHSDDGILSNVLGPVQAACADEFFFALYFVPEECQFSPYQRGGDHSDGQSGGVGNMPIEHWDLGQEPNQPRALRSFAKIDPVTGHEFAVAIRPESNPGTPNRLVPRDNWRIVVEPRLGLGELEKVA